MTIPIAAELLLGVRLSTWLLRSAVRELNQAPHRMMDSNGRCPEAQLNRMGT